MTHVIVKEFYIERQSEYFTHYAKQYTDLPFVVVLDPKGDVLVPGRFLRASGLGADGEHAQWKTIMYDSGSGTFRIPNGSIGYRWDNSGRWNLKLADNETQIEPLLSFGDDNDGWETVSFPIFETGKATVRSGLVPVKKIQTESGEIRVTTVFDLLVAHVGVRIKGMPETEGDYPTDYNDPQPYTPAWQEPITGVAKEDVIRVAREFAENAEKTRGKSMIFLWAGTNHW